MSGEYWLNAKKAMRLRRIKDLNGYTIGAIDTDIGSVSDFYFDDRQWAIRYIMVSTGIIFSGRKVLISTPGFAASSLEPAASLCEPDLGTSAQQPQH